MFAFRVLLRFPLERHVDACIKDIQSRVDGFILNRNEAVLLGVRVCLIVDCTTLEDQKNLIEISFQTESVETARQLGSNIVETSRFTLDKIYVQHSDPR